jgi:hypothetical protein
METAYTLLGVIIGGAIALLSPLLVYRMDKQKRKISIKPELVYTAAQFYGITKDHLHVINLHAYCHALLEHKQRALMAAPDDQQRIPIKEAIDELMGETKKFNNRINNNYPKLVDLESKLISLTSEIREYYGTEVFKSVSSLVRPIIAESNDIESIFLYKYHTLSESKLLEIRPTLPPTILAKQQKFQEKLEVFIDELNSVI